MIKRTNKGPPPPKELFALGSKAKQESDLKSPIGALKKTGGNAGAGGSSGSHMMTTSMKRERDLKSSINPTIIPAAKRPRLASGTLPSQSFTPLGRQPDVSEHRVSPAVQMYLYEDIALDVDGSTLVESVMDSLGDRERVEGLLCGAVKNLKSNKSKPDTSLYLAIMFLAKSKPELFHSKLVIEAFCSLLKKDNNPNVKAKLNGLVSVLVCNVFMTAMQDENSWPDAFVKAYLDDSLGDRMWIDRVECRCFVENISTAFNTKLPKTNFMQVDLAGKSDSSGNHVESEEVSSSTIQETVTGPVKDRYTDEQSIIEPHVLEVIRDQLSRRQPLDGGSQHLVRTLTILCGFSEVRTLVAQRLDLWLQSPKMTRAAQDLLMSVCVNCNPKVYPQDLELVNGLCRIRFKTKPLSIHFNLCLKELLGEESENMPLLLQQVVTNELSTMRNQNNMNFISVMLQQAPDQTTRMLADIILECLMSREEHNKALRLLIREVVRCSKSEFNFNVFVYSLLLEKNTSKFRDLDPLIKERYMMSVADLVSMTMFLCITSSVREASSNSARMDIKEMELLRTFQKQITFLQRDAVWWLHSVVVKMMSIKAVEYMHCLKKILFVEKPEVYSKIDNWPPESERGFMLKLVSDVPLMEDTLFRVVLIGLNKELHLSIPELINLLEVIVKRAACIYSEDFPALKVENTDFIGAILNLCAYKHPENTILPKGYKPPQLAITSFYWKALSILLILASFNPASIGLKAWKSYPTLKCLMEMVMTNNFCFPPVTMAIDDATAEEIKTQERQMAEYTKEQTLEFECHLAGSVITEANSRLLPQVTRMEPEGFIIKPPQSVLDSLRQLNQSLSLGKLLCQSREPADFLLNIIQRQGTSQSMPWLKDLVESNDSSLEVLPVQCLCEFLLHDIHYDAAADFPPHNDPKKKNVKQEQLVVRLQNLVRSLSNEPKVFELISQTLLYFFERLSFHQSYSRRQATKCLALILGKTSQDVDVEMAVDNDDGDILKPYHWLIGYLPSLHHFKAIKMQIFMCLRAACQVETNIFTVSAYLVFLSQHCADLELHEFDELVLDAAQLILERVSLISCLLPYESDVASSAPAANLVLLSLISLFHCHLSKAQQPTNETYSWANNQYQILLHWNSGQSAKMNILIVHATVILLTYGLPEGNSKFNELMDAWFPEDGSSPTAYLIDTSEEALLIPDWLKLRMIRSNVPRLIEASFQDAEIPQLLLFVQSFGISVESIDRLLHMLDDSLERNSAELLRLVVDKSYMAELIEVQHMRGATGGDKFYKLLLSGQQQAPHKQDDELLDLIRMRRISIKSEMPMKTEDSDNKITVMLNKVFMDEDISKSEKSIELRSLQRIVGNSQGVQLFIESCMQTIKSSSGVAFVKSLLKNFHASCPLFKLIISNFQGKEMEALCKKILSHSPSETHLLVKLLTSYLKNSINCSNVEATSTEEIIEVESTLLNREQVFKLLENVTENSGKMEETVLMVLTPFLQQASYSSYVLKALYHLLDTSNNSISSGFILDCLEAFNPQIIQPDLMECLFKIIFKKQIVHTFEKSPKIKSIDDGDGLDDEDEKPLLPLKPQLSSCSQYLLSLLLHRSGWSNLIQAINHLLPKSSPGSLEYYQKGTMLDFMEACLNVPNLWQGRDKRISKHQPIEDVLALNSNQVQILVSAVVDELRMEEQGNSVLIEEKIAKRLNLIENCCSSKLQKLEVAIETLLNLQGEDNSDAISGLLWGMYLRAPNVFTNLHVKLQSTRQSIKMFFANSSHVDIASHRMICCLLDVCLRSGKLDEDRLLHATMVSRKLASQHPFIFLRQLPLLSSFLNGHAQLIKGEAKSRHLVPLFTNVLGIIYLLQPYIFHTIHSMAFCDIIDSYAQVVSVQVFSARYLGGLVKKFIEIIFNYINYDPPRAVLGLKKHLVLFRKLDRHYGDFRLLQRLLLRLSCNNIDTSNKVVKSKDDEEENSRMEASNIEEGPSVFKKDESEVNDTCSFEFGIVRCLSPNLAVKPTQIWEHGKVFFALGQKTSRSCVSSTSELIEGLKELDDISRAHIDILEDFSDNIENLMLDHNTDCREAGYALMMRLMRYNPRCGKLFYKSLKKCLESEDLPVVQTALDTLKEFTVLAQEYARELLVTALKAGLEWEVDTTAVISQTLQILNLSLITSQ